MVPRAGEMGLSSRFTDFGLISGEAQLDLGFTCTDVVLVFVDKHACSKDNGSLADDDTDIFFKQADASFGSAVTAVP